MRTAAQTTGALAESLVVRELRIQGWTILGRNLRVGRAEIDVLALDPAGGGEVVAVEVRWRGRRDYGLPEETVDRAKLARLRAATLRLRDADAGDATSAPRVAIPRRPIRVDVIAVEPGGVVRHHRAVG